jgi:MSHA pilin protein MshA
MRRQSGFTLIELVIVIVVLGILAALAIPRFISLQREARIAVIDSLFNSVRSGANITYAKSAVEGETDLASAAVDIDGTGPLGSISTNFGYPQATSASMNLLFENLSPRYAFSGGGTAGGSTLTVNIDGIATCAITYQSPSVAGGTPVISRLIGGC